jgi:UDP-N-acetylglucosamine acyltransferase
MNNIHPTAIIYPNVYIGENVTIGPYCIIGAPPEWKGHEHESKGVIIGNGTIITGLVTIDAGVERPTTVGTNCYIMKHAHIGHDANIKSRVTISCGAKIGGHAVVNLDCNIGLNAVIHQKQNIAKGCMIGMGAVVTKKLITEPYKKYAGNPAKYIGENDVHPFYNIFQSESL